MEIHKLSYYRNAWEIIVLWKIMVNYIEMHIKLLYYKNASKLLYYQNTL